MRSEYIAELTFLSQIEAENVPILLKGEQALFAFETRGSTAIFSNARLIVAEATTKDMNILSIPYANMLMWSSKTSNNTSFYELYTKSGIIKITLKKEIDPIRFDRILAKFILSKKG